MSVTDELQDLAVQLEIEGWGVELPANWTAAQKVEWYEKAKRFDERQAEQRRRMHAWLVHLRELLGSNDAFIAFLLQRVRHYDPATPHTRWVIEHEIQRAREHGREMTEDEAAQEDWMQAVLRFVRNQVVDKRAPEAVIADETVIAKDRYRW